MFDPYAFIIGGCIGSIITLAICNHLAWVDHKAWSETYNRLLKAYFKQLEKNRKESEAESE